ncbi:low molecular weight protein-tyrosine-phosphatase [Dokdonia sp. 4H-3-7-5]|jgi:protein-tyrosine phosphatase|uniref:low molecular weight protein-tyrosine-phosphatase n=1 Tax=Dokdonia sp. (strain 4H-3-7-5) TaxID=983548 RepID=UPI00020A6D33|nr:low molecular weight protein-tyrosine-phosphatase [Dokdonia sp. 4H-3-7-5]AEE17999.1 protein tyrosine phosphatase [Dokdonia sp. 4H-3-7-5]
MNEAPTTVTNILMVCLGNICRSPLAEGILRSKLDATHFNIDSVGTGDWHVGNPPDPRSVKVGLSHGVDISGLRGRQLSESDFNDFDYIYVMDQNNLEDVLAKATTDEQRRKVVMILDVVFHGEKVDVPDPYHGSAEDFERVYEMLDTACDQIAKELA